MTTGAQRSHPARDDNARKKRLQRQIGDRIRRARELHTPKIHQYQLAEAVGIDRASMNQIERGNRMPDTGNLVRIAAALDVSIGALLEGRADPTGGQAHVSSDETQTERFDVSAAISQATDAALVNLAHAILEAIEARGTA